MEQLKRLDSMSECPACVTPFHDNPSPSESSFKMSLRLPSRGKRCDHRLCKSCVYTHHIAALDNEQHRFRRRSQFHLDCPVCKSQNSFYAKRPVVDHDLVQALKGTKSFRKELVKIHQTPWNIPVGAFAHILERIGHSDEADRTLSFRHDLVHDVLQGLMQIHDPSSLVTRSAA
jgi:hypothetical protein